MWEHYSCYISWDVRGTWLFWWRHASVQPKTFAEPAAHNTLVTQPIKARRLKRRLSRVSKFIVCIIVKSPEEKQDRLLVFLFFRELSGNIPSNETDNSAEQLRGDFLNRIKVLRLHRNYILSLYNYSYSWLVCLDPDCPGLILWISYLYIYISKFHDRGKFTLFMHLFQKYSPIL